MIQASLQQVTFDRVYGPSSTQTALTHFLIPALAKSTNYDRAAGYFSSTVFFEAAAGISGLVANGGRMRLVASHVLSDRDYEILSNPSNQKLDWQQVLAEDFGKALAAGQTIEHRMKASYLGAMCWMLREGYLELRFVVPGGTTSTSNDFEKFHPKFGILSDHIGNEVAFSGSVNETRLGWVANLENLSVYPSWDLGTVQYVEAYKAQFQDYWNGNHISGWRTVELPEAIKADLVAMAPPGGFPDLSEWEQPSEPVKMAQRSPRAYQLEAVKAWELADRVGLLEMATGTGKTFTANLCLNSAQALGTLLTLVVAPYQHISDQWVSELAEYNPVQVGSVGSWQQQLATIALEVALGNIENLTLVAVKNTAAKDEFVKAINDLADHFQNFMFIGDEVHWLGAQKFQTALNDKANIRLGLSATPNRYFDEAGTAVIRDYFHGDSAFVFGLSEALNWQNSDGTKGVLAPYEYWPIFVELMDHEMEEYTKLSNQIAQISSKENKSIKDREILETLANKRSEISKNAANKIPGLSRLLKQLGSGLTSCLIYCANFTQMSLAMEVARKSGISTPSRITGEEDAKKSKEFSGFSEREHILTNFAKGNLAVLFAIDCLDEGVDIPSAEVGIILASSGNPKEFIQRRGRLMRQSPQTGKEKAVIYDFIVLPQAGQTSNALRRVELSRVKEFGELAINKDHVDKVIAEMEGN